MGSREAMTVLTWRLSIYRSLSPSKYRSLIRCRPLAKGSRRAVPKNAQLFACTEINCKASPLRDRAGLARHRREVHKLGKDRIPAETFPCPVQTCNRHKNGFSRRANMKEHFKRTHEPKSSTSPMSVSGDSSTSRVLEEEDDIQAAEKLQPPLRSRSQQENKSTCGSLHAELDRWEREELRIQRKIAALKQAIIIMEEG